MEAPRALAARPPSGRKTKARAPPPPGKPALPSMPSEQKPPRDAAIGCHQNLIHQQEALRDSTLDVTVVLPSGLEKQSVVSGSHAMMDLLVELCLQNHLNPSHHALEIRSAETQQPLSFKPNTLVGTLNVHTVFLKEKVPEEKAKPGPRKVPEKSVRLVVNYLRTQKAVVRVSPDAPLRSILPLICAKCEVSPEHVVLLREAAGEELELSKSLSELGIKELYAWDNRRETFRKSSLGNDETDAEKKKFLGFLKANKRSNSKGCLTTPSSPSEQPRSWSLGPARSLGSLSGASGKSEMKKRQAPPPPGSGPRVQDKTSEKVSLGSQVDLQKKKRRAPAPPPPQPPPPSPLVPNRREDKEENRKSTMVSLLLSPGSHSSVDSSPAVTSEAEETISVGSCFASEDTTEDSGVISSPSDIVSLDSQHDSLKSKDKWATDQEDCSDQDLAGTPELGPPKSPLWERPGPRDTCLRSETATVTSAEEDLFIDAHSRRTLAAPLGGRGPDEMEDSYDTDSSSAASSTDGGWGHCVQDGAMADVDTIPVTFIGEVSEEPGDSGLSSNRNNNAASSTSGGITGRGPCLPPCKAEQDQPQGGWSPPQDAGQGDLYRKAMGPVPKGASLAVKSPPANPSVKEPGSRHSSAHGERTQAPWGTEDQEARQPSSIPGPPAWCRRGHPAAGSYGLKQGLTTYKIVPPRSEMRCYDRGASLSTGAIEIDELGNLVSPAGASGRTEFPPLTPGVDTEARPLGKVKEFWRRGSSEKPPSQPAGCPAARVTPAATTSSVTMAAPIPTLAPSKPPQDSTVTTAPVPATLKQPTVPHAGERPQEDTRSRPPLAVAGQEKVPAVPMGELPFLRPHRRTSSQHVASAIARRMGSTPAPSDTARPHSVMEKGPSARRPVSPGQPLPTQGASARGLDTEPQGLDTRQPRPGDTSNTQPGRVADSPQRTAAATDKDSPIAVQGVSCSSASHLPLREPMSARWSCGPQKKPSDPKASLAPNSVHTLDRVRPIPTHPADVLTNGSAWDPEPPLCPQVSSTHSHSTLETGERPRPFPEARGDGDSSFPASIFGPKKKFKPVVQRPVPKDTCLHSVLMEAIQAAGGKDGLRKTAEPSTERGPRTLSYTEADSERSALMAAIRGHSGTRSLRKVSSSASAELQGCRNTAPPQVPQPPPGPCAPPAPPVAPGLGAGPLSETVDARQALLDAIRSGSGAARLKKVPLLV